MHLLVLAVMLLGMQKNPHTNNPQGKADNKPADRCQPAIVEVHTTCQPNADIGQNHQQNTAAEIKPFMMTNGEIVISFITFGYVIVSIFTFFAIKRQADNAVLIERAWIDIEMEGNSGSTDYALNVTNHGRTVAKIKSWAICPLAIPFQGTFGDRPQWPKEMLKKNDINRLVTPTSSKILLEYIPVIHFFMEDWQMIVSMNKKAYFFVAVTYEDTSGQLRATKACYMYSLTHKFVDLPQMKNWT